MSIIKNIRTLFPVTSYSQKYTANVFSNLLKNKSPDVTTKINKVYSNTGIDKRHFIFNPNVAIEKHRVNTVYPIVIGKCSELLRSSITDLFNDSNYSAHKIDKVIFSSGIPISPHIDTYAMKDMGFRQNLKREPLVSLGCVGGAVALSEAHDYLKAYPKHSVLNLNIECASRYFMGIYKNRLDEIISEETYNNKDMMHEIIVSSILGDGCASTLLVGKDNTDNIKHNINIEIFDTHSKIVPDSEHLTGQVLEEAGFRAIIRHNLADIVVPNAYNTLIELLEKNSLSKSDINYWFIHPGGMKVLTKLKEVSGLTNNELKYSIQSLKDYGNVSSVSVLNVIEKTFKNEKMKPNAYACILSMGPGITIQALLVKIL